MKRGSTRNLLGLTLALALGTGFHLCAVQAKAQAAVPQAEAASAQVAQSPKKNEVADEEKAYRESPSVVWLGSKLGMNPSQSATAFEVANFLVLALAFLWLLAKLLPKVLRDRSASIQKHLVDARSATEEARLRLSGVEQRLAKLDGEIASMRARAEQDSVREEERIKVAVEEERKKIVASAEQEIAAATMHAQKQLQQHAAELAIEQAARKLVVSAETDRLLVQGFAQRLTGDGSKKGQN